MPISGRKYKGNTSAATRPTLQSSVNQGGASEYRPDKRGCLSAGRSMESEGRPAKTWICLSGGCVQTAEIDSISSSKTWSLRVGRYWPVLIFLLISSPYLTSTLLRVRLEESTSRSRTDFSSLIFFSTGQFEIQMRR